MKVKHFVINLFFTGKNMYNVKSSEIERDEKDTELTRSNDANITNNLYNENTKKKLSDINKKLSKKVILQKKDLSNITATSIWNVESIESANAETVFHSSTLDILNNEKMSNLFDIMEEKMQNQIKSKLQHITQNYNKMTEKRKIKESVKFKEENFDGLEMQAKSQKPIIDTSLHESIDESNLELNTELENSKNIECNNTLFINKRNRSEIEIDPNKYINVKHKQLNTNFPTVITRGDDVLDDSDNEDEKQNVISEAFADDDVVEQFQKEKQEEVH